MLWSQLQRLKQQKNDFCDAAVRRRINDSIARAFYLFVHQDWIFNKAPARVQHVAEWIAVEKNRWALNRWADLRKEKKRKRALLNGAALALRHAAQKRLWTAMSLHVAIRRRNGSLIRHAPLGLQHFWLKRVLNSWMDFTSSVTHNKSLIRFGA